MTKYFLKAEWQDEGKEVTKEQYMAAEENAGFHSKFEGEPATASFGGKGIEGWTEGKEPSDVKKEPFTIAFGSWPEIK